VKKLCVSPLTTIGSSAAGPSGSANDLRLFKLSTLCENSFLPIGKRDEFESVATSSFGEGCICAGHQTLYPFVRVICYLFVFLLDGRQATREHAFVTCAARESSPELFMDSRCDDDLTRLPSEDVERHSGAREVAVCTRNHGMRWGTRTLQHRHAASLRLLSRRSNTPAYPLPRWARTHARENESTCAPERGHSTLSLTSTQMRVVVRLLLRVLQQPPSRVLRRPPRSVL